MLKMIKCVCQTSEYEISTFTKISSCSTAVISALCGALTLRDRSDHPGVTVHHLWILGASIPANMIYCKLVYLHM